MDGAGRAWVPWRRYLREAVPPLLGAVFREATWNSGFVKEGQDLVLLVTLQKQDLGAEFQYGDRFLGPDLFEWQSQNRTRRGAPSGRQLRDHAAVGLRVHLFVRRAKKVHGKAAPFTYCGRVAFVDWENDAPITVRWRLADPVPPELRHDLLVPSSGEAGAEA